jgi:hypothetical protein
VKGDQTSLGKNRPKYGPTPIYSKINTYSLPSKIVVQKLGYFCKKLPKDNLVTLAGCHAEQPTLTMYQC